MGWGTYGSRTTAVGGAALATAVGKIKDKAKLLTAHLLEAAPEDIDYADGRFFVKGSPARGKTIQDIALMANVAWNMPPGMEAGLEASSFYDPPNFVYPFGAHVAVVEIDPETGRVDLKRYVAVDDCGPQINPMIVEGQVHGGVVQGIGQALWEGAVYDEPRPAAHRLAARLRDSAGRRAARYRSAVHRHAVAAPSARRQGHRRSRHHRLDGDGLQRGDRRARAVRRPRPDDAVDAGTGMAGDAAARGALTMFAAPFDYYPRRIDRRGTATAAAASGREAPGRRTQSDSAAEAAAGDATGGRRHRPHRRAERRSHNATTLRIGALTTHADLAASAMVKLHSPVLAEAAAGIGDSQVRNAGTIGGNIAHADPASDLPVTLLALDATFHAVGPHGQRTIPAANFFLGMMTTALEPDEILTAIEVPSRLPGQGMAYAKFRHPASAIRRRSVSRRCWPAMAAPRPSAPGRGLPSAVCCRRQSDAPASNRRSPASRSAASRVSRRGQPGHHAAPRAWRRCDGRYLRLGRVPEGDGADLRGAGPQRRSRANGLAARGDGPVSPTDD